MYFKTLLEIFDSIPDTRRSQGKRFDLPHFLLYCVLAIMAGATSYAGIQIVIKSKLKLLNKTFGTEWKKAPSVGGIYKIISGLDTKSLEEAFRVWSLNSATKLVKKDSLGNPKLVMAIDGKALRGTRDLEDGSIKNLVSVFETMTDLILGHILTEGKESELKVVEELVLELQIPYTTITMDALHTQKNNR